MARTVVGNDLAIADLKCFGFLVDSIVNFHGTHFSIVPGGGGNVVVTVFQIGGIDFVGYNFAAVLASHFLCASSVIIVAVG